MKEEEKKKRTRITTVGITTTIASWSIAVTYKVSLH